MTTSNSSKGLKGLITIIAVGAVAIGWWGISQQPPTPSVVHDAGSNVDATVVDATLIQDAGTPAPPATGTGWLDAPAP